MHANGQPPGPKILAIESSCDDTAAAVLDGAVLRSSVISSQLDHARFGGVVPEIASRAHQRLIVPVVEKALRDAGCSLDDIDAIAVTQGPGLPGSLMVGVSFAKALAIGRGLPLVAVNHLEGHVYSVLLDDAPPSLPMLSLIVSGGHTQLVQVGEDLEHTTIGRTRDDAAGEAFDKIGKLMGLGYPAGPEIDRLARTGNPRFHSFPRSRPGAFDFSFSGLKTSVLYYLNRLQEDERDAFIEANLPDLCASVQDAIVDVLLDVTSDALKHTGVRSLAIVGGVSANSRLRERAQAVAEKAGVSLHIPSPSYCTDNAAMIAMAARLKLDRGMVAEPTIVADPSMHL
jgi:N6-L-threonylcarbamoyladenine synthase